MTIKLKEILIIAIISSLFNSTLIPTKALAHIPCESYSNCHRTPVDREKINYWTNYFFKLVRPEMRHKRVRAYHTLYRRELTEIRRVVTKVIDRSCQQPHLSYYYLLTEKEENNHKDRDRAKRRFTPRERGLRFDDNRELALRDRYDDWERADYYESELDWDEQLWSEGYYWQRTEDYFFNGLYRDLADAIFQARHPELSREITIKNNLNWATEWTFIRQYFASFEEEKFLKQHFIPLCDAKDY